MHSVQSKKTIMSGSLVFLLITIVILGITGQAAAKDGLVRKIVMFEKNFVDEDAQKGLLLAHGAKGRGLKLGLINGMAVRLPEKAIAALTRNTEILQVEDDTVIYASKKPPWAGNGDDGGAPEPGQVMPWGVDRIDAEWAWPLKGTGVKVAVIDSGIDKNHPDLSVAGGINFVGSLLGKRPIPNRWDDDFGHGTHVGGTIAALDNAKGVVGVAPDVSLYAVKVLNRDGIGFTSDVIAGIEWAVNNGMHLANMSLSSNHQETALYAACNAARDAGLIMVAAAGNDGREVDFPAAYDSVIAVAALDSSDYVAHFSSRGAEIDVAAPGVSIESTTAGGGYATDNGTSMAAPHVTGALALRISEDLMSGGIGHLEFYRSALCTTADDLGPEGPDPLTGCGIVDAAQLATGIELGNDLP
ncbi:MAG: S8 family peptidase [Desulfobulbales bacterium]|nr:S8 family peptidase [Desulfobulbales bacterium]